MDNLINKIVNNVQIKIKITSKELLIVLGMIILSITITTFRHPTPYESFNQQINKCNNSECRTQVIGFYRQSIRDIEELKDIEKYAERIK